MCQMLLNDELWVNENFKNVDLKDKRLNKRLLRTIEKMIERPSAGIPKQMNTWKDIKGCYRLLNNSKVSHKRVQTPHRNRVKELSSQKSGKVVLFIQDTSEVESKPATKEVGPIGNHTCRGVMIHSCLAVEFGANPVVLGLANQQLWKREETSKCKKETRRERSKRSGKESDVWSKTLKHIGNPSNECTWVSVGDRGNDIYDFFADLKHGWEAVIRASKDRAIQIEGKKKLLMEFAKSLPNMGSKTITIRKKNETKSKNILLNISWADIEICPPCLKTGVNANISISIIRCWNEKEDIEWFIYSTIPIKNLEDAIEKIEWYSCRWIIEEFHKCLKTGCKIESSQLGNGHGLEVLVGILSIVSLLMLNLRDEAREENNMLAKDVVPEIPLRIICMKFDLKREEITVKEFWRTVARLGGFIGRKSDGEPGWQTLWHGWVRLLDMWLGAEALEISMGKIN